MKWSEDYATGIKQVDQDHKMIFQMCEDFCSALDAGSGADVYSVMLDNLTLYCRGHFDFEEGCMAKHDCSMAETNKTAHKELTHILSGFQQSYTMHGFDRAEARLLVDTTDQWLQSHVCDVDIHLKNCVNK